MPTVCWYHSVSWGFREQAWESTCSYGAYILLEEDTRKSRKQTRAFQIAVSAIDETTGWCESDWGRGIRIGWLEKASLRRGHLNWNWWARKVQSCTKIIWCFLHSGTWVSLSCCTLPCFCTFAMYRVCVDHSRDVNNFLQQRDIALWCYYKKNKTNEGSLCP